jgi:hypothetical protein
MSDFQEYLVHLLDLSERLKRSGYNETLPHLILALDPFEISEAMHEIPLEPEQTIVEQPASEIIEPEPRSREQLIEEVHEQSKKMLLDFGKSRG